MDLLLTGTGIACRMLTDLGLHELASTRGIHKEVLESSKEGDLAYALLSACVVYEGVWTLYLGRPSSIPSSIMSVAASRCREGREADSPWLNAWVGLCMPMAAITHVLNETSISDLDKSSTLRELFKQMEEWYDSLPSELTYDENRLTSMNLAGYGLHAQYCKLQILLRRALARPPNVRKRRHSRTLDDGIAQVSSDDPTVIAYQYALRIARLVVTYREAFGMEKMPSIMLDNAVVAATAMIGHLNRADSVDEVKHEMVWLRQLVKSIESVQPHFPIAGRMLDSLKQIRGSGTLLGRLPQAPQTLTDAPLQDFPAQYQSLDPRTTADNTKNNSLGLVNGPDSIWNSFDTGIAPDIFSSRGFDDFITSLTPSEAWVSNWPQSVS